MDNFTQIPFRLDNLDRYYIRTSIFNAVKLNLNNFQGKLLDFGCGKMPYKDFILKNSNVTEYIGLDIENSIDYDGIKPDFTWRGNILPFEENTFNSVIATEVLEHVPDLHLSLNEIYRVLKNNGTLFFTVPFLWPLHETPHDECRYTPFSIERILNEIGFSEINIKATGGWHASLAQMLALWVRRSNMTNRKRTILSIILKPIIKFLIKKDKIPSLFNEGQMITGLYGIAKK